MIWYWKNMCGFWDLTISDLKNLQNIMLFHFLSAHHASYARYKIFLDISLAQKFFSYNIFGILKIPNVACCCQGLKKISFYACSWWRRSSFTAGWKLICGRNYSPSCWTYIHFLLCNSLEVSGEPSNLVTARKTHRA